jgi:uncharacterized LabA/DUF88 family protein
MAHSHQGLTNNKKKTYLEAALTPLMISPINSPSSPYVKKEVKIGIIETRLKWYNNKINKEDNCSVCKKGIQKDEWNSYYNIYLLRYKYDIDEYKIKVFNNREIHDDSIYCDSCKENVIKKHNENIEKEKNPIRIIYIRI